MLRSLVLCSLVFVGLLTVVFAQDTRVISAKGKSKIGYADLSDPAGLLDESQRQVLNSSLMRLLTTGEYSVQRLGQSPEYETVAGLLEQYKQTLTTPGGAPAGVPELDIYVRLLRREIQLKSDRMRGRLEFSIILIDRNTVAVHDDFSMYALGIAATEADVLRSAAEDLAAEIQIRLKKKAAGSGTGVVLALEDHLVLIGTTPAGQVRVGDEMYSQAGDGLVTIRETAASLAFATVVYGEPVAGDSYAGLRRLGLDSAIYAGTVITGSGEIIPLAGFEAALARGLYRFHPVLGLEYAYLPDYSSAATPLFPHAGLEMLWRRGRLEIVVTGAAGIGLSGSGGSLEVTHSGGFGSLGLRWRVLRSAQIRANAGYCAWYGTNSLAADETYSYNGIRVSGGFVWKL